MIFKTLNPINLQRAPSRTLKGYDKGSCKGVFKGTTVDDIDHALPIRMNVP